MPSPRLDDEIDRLYQLPLEEFTAARNLLAKTGGAEVRSLVKPPLAAWAVNQLYWKQRDVYAALIDASEDARRTHRAVLAGKAGDLRAAGKAHDEAVDAALKATLAWLEENGQPATESTRQGVLTTLRALPANEPPGRLTRILQPGGFEMLAGFSIAGGGRVPAAPAKLPASRPKGAPEKSEPAAKGKVTAAEKAAREKAQAKAREAAAAATRELRQAEHAARREEFEAARTSREAEKAERQAAEARTAFEEAKAALEEAEAAVPPALRAREAAARRARQAEEKVQTLRDRLEAAQARL